MIFLMILKWIGIVLLCILLFLLLALLYLLFAPLRLRLFVKGDYKAEETSRKRDVLFQVRDAEELDPLAGLEAGLTIRGFVGFWHVDGDLKREDKIRVSAFWGLLQVYPKRHSALPKDDVNEELKKDKPDTDQTEKHPESDSTSDSIEKPKSETLSESIEKPESEALSDSSEITDSEALPDSSEITDSENISDVKKTVLKEKRKKSSSKKKRKKNSSSVFEKIKGIWDGLNEPTNKAVLQKILSQFPWLFKHMKLNIRGTDIAFSLESPDVTGQITGWLSLMPFAYAKDVVIKPDFVSDDMYFDGIFQARGRFAFWFPVKMILSILLYKPCRILIRKMKRK